MQDLGKLLLAGGAAIAALGGLVLLSSSAPGLRLGRLPGDIHIQRPNFSFYFPFTTLLLLSVLISGLLLFIGRLRR